MEECNSIIKLEALKKLENGWDNANAIRINDIVIKKVELILKGLKRQPEIFPLVNGNIQLEYEEPDGRYLEFEILDTNRIKVFKIDLMGKITTKEIGFNLSDISKEVDVFYG